MQTVEKMSIALTPEIAASVRMAVESGDYASSSEVIREALREWKARRESGATRMLEISRLASLSSSESLPPRGFFLGWWTVTPGSSCPWKALSR